MGCVVRRARCLARSLRRVAGLALVLAVVLPTVAQTNETHSGPLPNRYLLVVETSRSMLHRGPGTWNALSELLSSGFRGQIHTDDTIGVWTLGEELSTGRLPLQHWSPQDQAAISSRIQDLLNGQKYEKQPQFDKLLPALSYVVQNSPYITIILVTDGEDKIHGTPFDERINDTFQTWRERQQVSQQPFVTVLRARQGVITDCSVSPAPWPVELPPLPEELRVKEVIARQVAPKPPPAPVSTVPPLIIHGKKPAPVTVVAQSPALEETNTTTSSVETPSAGTNAAAPAFLSKADASAHLASQAAVGPKTLPSSAAASVASNLASKNSAASVAAVGERMASSASHQLSATAAATPANRKAFWLGAAVLVTALLGSAVVLFTRARPAAGPSLITQSLERQAK